MPAFKDLLVLVDTMPSCETRLRLAATLAARCGAHLTGLHVSPPPDIPVLVDAPLTADLIVRQQRVLAETRERAETVFRHHAKVPGVTPEWRADQGEPGNVAIRHARYADLTIVGQVDPDAPDPLPVDLPERVVLGAGRPVLVVPYAGRFETLGERVLVAWNATREAARAVHDAMPFLREASKVTALTINADKDLAGDLVRHLARHGVKAEASQLKSDDVEVGALLLSRAADFAADLMVMGAYGHSRLREVVLGGATREILRTMTVPVLMAH
ncbi:MAG TPA: universal stress protein [Methylomirabilota bacterium]|jgi:nucleotide-binding universal stress UspA family protein|nr:universal stress protein [Methylomirabilota bacterium]